MYLPGSHDVQERGGGVGVEGLCSQLLAAVFDLARHIPTQHACGCEWGFGRGSAISMHCAVPGTWGEGGVQVKTVTAVLSLRVE